MLTWTRSLTAAAVDARLIARRSAEYRANNVHMDARATVYAFLNSEGRKMWTALVEVGPVVLAIDSLGAFRTAKEAMRAADAAASAERTRQNIAERESGYAAARREGNKEGREAFARIAAQGGTDCTLSDMAYAAARAACGVFAPSAKRVAFERAFIAGYRDAEFMAEQDAKPAQSILPELDDMPEPSDSMWTDARCNVVPRILARVADGAAPDSVDSMVAAEMSGQPESERVAALDAVRAVLTAQRAIAALPLHAKAEDIRAALAELERAVAAAESGK